MQDDVGAYVTPVWYTATTGDEVQLYLRFWGIPKDPMLFGGTAAKDSDASGKAAKKPPRGTWEGWFAVVTKMILSYSIAVGRS